MKRSHIFLQNFLMRAELKVQGRGKAMWCASFDLIQDDFHSLNELVTHTDESEVDFKHMVHRLYVAKN